MLLVDTFNRYFEPENARAAIRVLQAAGYRVHAAQPVQEDGAAALLWPDFLSAGLIEEARTEARRMLDALEPWLAHGIPIIGLEPSCLYMLTRRIRRAAAGDRAPGRSTPCCSKSFSRPKPMPGASKLKLKPIAERGAAARPLPPEGVRRDGCGRARLRLVPGLNVTTVESSCCGMAGSFGYEAEHYDVSMKMGEASLLPAVRKAVRRTRWSLPTARAAGTRSSIGAQRQALHVARVLEQRSPSARSRLLPQFDRLAAPAQPLAARLQVALERGSRR